MLDGQFLKILRDKLSKGSTNSVLLNCLPGTNLYKIDVTELNLIDPQAANNFVGKLLLESNFTFPISFQDIQEKDLIEEKKLFLERLSKKLNRVFNDNELSFQEKGHRTFGFGYPIFVIEVEDSFVLSKVNAKTRPKRLIAAPLFIWPLEIGKSFKQSRSWMLRKLEDSTPFLNDSFASYIKQKHGVDLFSLFESENDEIFTYEKLQRNVGQIIKAINKFEKKVTDIFSPNDLVVPLRTKDELIERSSSTGFVEWSGVLSLYSKQKQSLINELDTLIENKDIFSTDEESTSEGNPFLHNFSSLDTDYSQQNVIDQLKFGSRFVIQGPPGTGKSQTLTALVTNALSNGKKTLVVCEKSTALEVIHNNLQALGLGDLCALINDPTSKDRQKVVEKVRSAPLANYEGVSEIKFQNTISDVNESIKELSRGYAALMKNIWEDQIWADMLGKYLKVRKKIKDNPLKIPLKEIVWELNSDEYRDIRRVAIKSQDLQSRNESSLITKLNKDFFSSERKGLVKVTIHDYAQDTLASLKELSDHFDEFPEKCRTSVFDYYNQLVEELDAAISNFDENYEQLNRLFPELTDLLPSSFNDQLTKVASFFSPKTKRANHYRAEILNAYKKLLPLSKKLKRLEFKFLPDPEFLKLSLLNSSLSEFKKSIRNFKKEQDSEISITVENFLRDGNENEIIDSVIWEDLSEELTKVIEKINEIKLLDKKVKSPDTDNFYSKKQLIEDLTKSVNQIVNNLNNFSAFYDYERFVSTLNEREKKVVKVFSELKQAGQVRSNIDLFDRYYLEKILLDNQDPNTINSSDQLDLLYKKINQLKQLVTQKVLSTFGGLQRKSVRDYPGYKSLYNLRGAGGQRRNSLRQIVRKDFNFFTSFFPVILTNPTACATLFPLEQDLFDLVIFDEASQLRLEDTFSSLIRGKHKIVSGDQHQMPPARQYELTNAWTDEDDADEASENQDVIIDSNITKGLANSESLLDYALTIGYKKTHLLVHYRSNHPALINFSNNAFYSGNLLPIIRKEDYTPITFYQVNGLYKDRTNPEEADKAIEILNDIIKPKEGICPSVGIATFNLYQRDLILDKINSKASIDSQFSEKMAMVYKKGFFVKNLENIQGDERDVIIMTTTFGKDKDGRFKKHFGPLQNKSGYRLLNVIITRAKNHFYVCTSIPEEEYLAYERELKRVGKNDGTPIVMAYLAYAKAVSENNTSAIEHVLDVVKKGSTEERISTAPLIDTESPFEEEVLEELGSIVADVSRIKSQVWIGSFRVDFLIDPVDEKRKPLVIECDGATYHGTSEAYAYDYFRKRQLRESGYEVYNIWSTNWFDEDEFFNEVEELKELLTEYDSTSPENTKFAKEKKKGTSGSAEDDLDLDNEFNMDFVETEVADILEDSDTDADSLEVNSPSQTNHQQSFFPSDQVVELELPLSSDIWFQLSHWGKESGNMTPFNNRFCYSIGRYISKNGNMTPKQTSFAKKVYKQAVAKGFIYKPDQKKKE